MRKYKSEFGKGLTYCLGLFLGHADRLYNDLKLYRDMREKSPELFKENSAVAMWFNASSDHLYELQCDSAPKHLRARCKKLKNKALDIGHGFGKAEMECTKEDALWAMNEAKELLRLIDKANGIEVEKAQWN